MKNEQVILKGLDIAKTVIRKQIVDAIKKTAFDLENLRPFNLEWTHNLLDSIGCGIYENGVLIDFIVPRSEAPEPRSGDSEFPAEYRKIKGSEQPIYDVDGIDVNRTYWGDKELLDMLTDPPPEILKPGWSLYYVAAMPYAEFLDDTGEIVLADERVVPIFKTHIKKL